MLLHHLKHFLTQPENLKETAAWWCDVLGLEEGPHPDFGFPVKWLYIGDNDVVHMTTGGANVSDARKNYLGQQSEVVNGSGVVDHIPFRCTGLGDTLAHLLESQSLFRKNESMIRLSINCFCWIPTASK